MERYKVEIAIVRTFNISALLIHLGGFIWYLLHFRKPKKIFNHVQIIYPQNNGLGSDLTSGALSHGVKNQTWKGYIKDLKSKRKNGAIIRRYPVYLTKVQLIRGRRYIEKTNGTKYEFMNFFWHAVKIFTGIWFGSKNSKALYCYEHALRYLDSTRKFTTVDGSKIGIDLFMAPWEFADWANDRLPAPYPDQDIFDS